MLWRRRRHRRASCVVTPARTSPRGPGDVMSFNAWMAALIWYVTHPHQPHAHTHTYTLTSSHTHTHRHTAIISKSVQMRSLFGGWAGGWATKYGDLNERAHCGRFAGLNNQIKCEQNTYISTAAPAQIVSIFSMFDWAATPIHTPYNPRNIYIYIGVW